MIRDNLRIILILFIKYFKLKVIKKNELSFVFLAEFLWLRNILTPPLFGGRGSD